MGRRWRKVWGIAFVSCIGLTSALQVLRAVLVDSAFTGAIATLWVVLWAWACVNEWRQWR